MKLRSVLRTTTAVTAVGIAFPLGAVAAEVKAGGALDITITGFLRAEAGGGAAGRSAAGPRQGARARFPQRHRGPCPGPRQERGDRAGIWCHGRVRGRHQPDLEHRRDLDLPARRLGRAAHGRRGRCGRQQHHRRPDDRGRHGRYRRLDFVVCRIARRGRVPDRDRRRDQDPLLHAELRRIQPGRQLHADRRRVDSGDQQRRLHRQQEAATTPRWRPRTSSRAPWSTTASFGDVGIKARWSAFTAS